RPTLPWSVRRRASSRARRRRRSRRQGWWRRRPRVLRRAPACDSTRGRRSRRVRGSGPSAPPSRPCPGRRLRSRSKKPSARCTVGTMARGGTAKDARRELPPPLPPERRTVGQLVAETIRFYQHNFWRSLAIGVLPGVAGVAAAELSGWHRYVFAIALAPVFTASYVAACALVGEGPRRSAAALRALVAGVLVYLPFPFLTLVFVLPGLAWFALFGMVVPVALIEGLGVRASFGRALRLGRADFAHALGGLCALAIVAV